MNTNNKGTIFFVCVLCLAGYLIAINIANKKNKLQTTSEIKVLKTNESDKNESLAKNRKGYWSIEHTGKPVWLEKNPIEKSPTETTFDEKLKKYLDKEFVIIPHGSEQAKKSKMLQSKFYWISNYISNNEVWFKSDYHDDLSDSKITIFFNFYQCDGLNTKAQSSAKCFKVFMYNFRNDNWYRTSELTSEENIRWRNNTAYAQVNLDHLGDFTRHTEAWYLMIPIPRDSMPVYYIKYEDSKFILEKGPDSDWVLVTEKEVEEFQSWTRGYKVKHGDVPAP